MISKRKVILLPVILSILFSCFDNNKSGTAVNPSKTENPYLVKEFGLDGLACYSNTIYMEFIYSDIVLDSSGNIYASGNSSGLKMYLNKYLSGGIPDSAFGDNGTSMIDGESYAIALDKDGNIFVVGYSFNQAMQMTIWKFYSDGKLDPSFGNSGIAAYSEDGSNSIGFGVTIDPSGNLFVVGRRQPGMDCTMTIWKYSSSGIIDTNFGNNGIVNYGDPSKYNCWGRRIKMDSSGNLIITGGKDVYMSIWKYSPAGTPDLTFNGSGVVSGYFKGWGTDLTLDSQDNIFVTGIAYDGSNGYKILLCKYDKNGNPDKLFGPYSNGCNEFINWYDVGASIALDNDGRIIVGGHDGASAAIWRYTANGILDTSLNGTGLIEYDIPGVNSIEFSECNRVLFDTEGSLFFAGYTSNISKTQMTIWKYLLP